MKQMRRGCAATMVLSLVIAALVSVGLYPISADAAPEIQWLHQFGTSGYDHAPRVAADVTGVYVLGTTAGTFPGETNMGGSDVLLCKFDSGGSLLWAEQFGSNTSDSGNGIATHASGIYVVGYTTGTLPGETSSGGDDAFVAKFDSGGNLLWIAQFGTSGDDHGFAIAADSTSVYVAGGTDGVFWGQTGMGGFDAFLTRLDTDGNLDWSSQFGTASLDTSFGVATDASGICVTGYTFGTFSNQTSLGNIDAYVTKFDCSGNMQWLSQFGTSDYDVARDVGMTPSGVYVAGYTAGTFPNETSAGDRDVFVAGFDPNGGSMWAGQYGSSGSDSGLGMCMDSTGIYVCGDTYGAMPGQNSSGQVDAFVLKLDFSGILGWTLQLGTSEEDAAVGIASHGSRTYIAGSTHGTFPGQIAAGDKDFFLASLRKTAVTATIDIDPNTLNLKSKGRWITAYITLPEGCDVQDIDTGSVMLEAAIPAQWGEVQGTTLMVKFDRSQVEDLIGSPDDSVTLTVTGQLSDGTQFSGDDTIRAIRPGK